MKKYIWSIASSLFEWTPEGVNYSNQRFMDHVNNVFLNPDYPKLRDYHRSPMWGMEDGFDTPEKFAVLLAKSFGRNISLEESPDDFREWHKKNAAPYHYYDCGLTE